MKVWLITWKTHDACLCGNDALLNFLVVRISMNHEEEKKLTGNKVEQANVQKYFTHHVKYGWLFGKGTMCFEMIRARKFEKIGPGLCLKRRHGMCPFII